MSCVVTVDADGVTSTGGMATAMNSAAAQTRLDEEARLDALRAVMTNVDISSITVGLIIRPGTNEIEPGGSMDMYDATFTCPAVAEVACVVTVELNYDGTNTVKSAGGAATAMVSAAGTLKLTATGSVDMSMVTAGLTEITEGMYPLQPGGNMDAGDVTFTCPVVGVPCTVTVTVTDDVDADDEKTGTTTTTVTFLGGMAMAADSAAGKVKLAVENEALVVTGLAPRYTTITVGMYTIQPGENLDVGEANFVCPAGGIPCVVTVTEEANDDGTTATITIKSTGGMATIRNSMAVMNTRAALSLNTANTALNMQSDGELTAVSVTRSTDGVTTTIKLTPSVTEGILFTSDAVDTGHEISGWPGQTLTRGTGIGDDDDGLPIPEEATVYTNIERAMARKLTYGGEEPTSGPAIPAPSADVSILLAENQDVGMLHVLADTARTFKGTVSGVSGTFTCAAARACDAIEPQTNDGGQMYINAALGDWTFKSDEYVESVALQSEDYLYFGYWLRSPEDATIANPTYQFSAFFGGGTTAEFTVPPELIDAADALKATYRGGAAGRYVTRKLTFTDQGVDLKSPAYHGRFTANAELNAYFGAHETFEKIEATDDVKERPSRQNMIQGTITDFMDGDTDLGFEVTLGTAANRLIMVR